MNVKLDNGSEILGTYQVRKNGVVSGLSSYEGKKVLVILLPPRDVKREEM